MVDKVKPGGNLLLLGLGLGLAKEAAMMVMLLIVGVNSRGCRCYNWDGI
jgi:hypothetical protein